MAKVTLMEPYGSISGMICKHFGVVNQCKYHGTEQILVRRHNKTDWSKVPTAVKLGNNGKIMAPIVAGIMGNQSQAPYTTYKAAFEKYPGKYKTLRGYIYAQEWTKAKTAGTIQ